MNLKRSITPLTRQTGLAGFAIVVILSLIFASSLVGFATYASRSLDRDQHTQKALAQAKDALLAFAVGNPDRGHLPCPADPALAGSATDGTMLATCPSAGSRIGRLPWRSLGIQELTDGNGVPLWYAVSANFTNDAVTINSEQSAGSLSVNGVGAHAAIVLSAGDVLPGQARTTTVSLCATTGTALREDYCPANYLDVDSVSAISNADADATFVYTKGSVFNDQLLTLSPRQFFARVENRVLQDVKSCLLKYANQAGNTLNLFPWAHPVDLSQADPSVKTLNYTDQANMPIGRISDTPTNSGFAWTTGCPLPTCTTGLCTATTNWRTDWRELVFYAVSPEYIPGGPGGGIPGTMTVGAASNVRAAVLIAGTLVGAQTRTTANARNTPSQYLEANDITTYASYASVMSPPPTWDHGPPTSTFNDRTVIVAP